jgi:hypothetical protein
MPRFSKTTSPFVKRKDGSSRPKTMREDSRDHRRRVEAFSRESMRKGHRINRRRNRQNNSGLLDPLINLAFKLVKWLLLLPLRPIARLFRR